VHSGNQFDPTKSQITRLSHSTEFHPLAPLPQPARRTSASMSCPGKSRCPMTHESCGFCRKNNRASEQKLRVFYFGSSRAPLQSTMRLRRASSPPFSKTSLVSVISLIILAARSVSPAGSPSRFSPSRPLSLLLVLIALDPRVYKRPRPHLASSKVMRSEAPVSHSSCSFLSFHTRADRPMANRARVLSLVLPVLHPPSRPLLHFRLLAIVIARSIAASVRSFLTRLPFSFYVPAKTLAPRLRSCKIGNVSVRQLSPPSSLILARSHFLRDADSSLHYFRTHS
jgi:hypothetical protein